MRRISKWAMGWVFLVAMGCDAAPLPEAQSSALTTDGGDAGEVDAGAGDAGDVDAGDAGPPGCDCDGSPATNKAQDEKRWFLADGDGEQVDNNGNNQPAVCPVALITASIASPSDGECCDSGDPKFLLRVRVSSDLPTLPGGDDEEEHSDVWDQPMTAWSSPAAGGNRAICQQRANLRDGNGETDSVLQELGTEGPARPTTRTGAELATGCFHGDQELPTTYMPGENPETGMPTGFGELACQGEIPIECEGDACTFEGGGTQYIRISSNARNLCVEFTMDITPGEWCRMDEVTAAVRKLYYFRNDGGSWQEWDQTTADTWRPVRRGTPADTARRRCIPDAPAS